MKKEQLSRQRNCVSLGQQVITPCQNYGYWEQGFCCKWSDLLQAYDLIHSGDP